MKEKAMLPGCRVLDLCDEKGWFCSKLLAGLGMDVVRLDLSDRQAAADYHLTGKRSLSMDIKKPRGRALLFQLITHCDVLIENFLPGYLNSLEMDYPALAKITPALVMASITPFGQTGPSSLRHSSDLTAGAAGGQLYLNGDPDKAPLPIYGQQAGLVAALFAANGILMALRHRRLSGQGQYIDISIQECVAGCLDHALVRYFSQQEIACRQGNLYWNNTFGLFRCRDGWAGLTYLEPWNTLVEWMDSEGMAADLKDACWQDPLERERKRAHIIEVMRLWTLTHSVEDLVETGQLMRLPWARVFRIEEMPDNPQLKARGYFATAEDPSSATLFQFPGAPVKLSVSAWQVDNHLAGKGDNNAEILREWLGLNNVEIQSLEDEGVV